ncbi:peptidase M28 [Flammeovirgaceae bacterium 311]|nr:peptidase M28 [Flammeovirgaceae bacterium 311]
MEANIKNLYQHVAFLTELQPARNYRNLASLDKAATYIHEQFSAHDFNVVEYQPFKVKSGNTYKNISARIEGKSKERIVVGAHYDVWGELPGADDNASAVAGLLETARLLSNFSKEHRPAYTLEFVAYCLEEPPFFATDEMGSAVHARELHNNKTPLKLMVCYEMIGYFSDEAGSQGFPHPSLKELYPDKGNFIIVGGHSSQPAVAQNFAGLMQKACNIPVHPVASQVTDGPVALSDHRSYWKYQFPAVMINDTSFLRNPNYHEKTDTIDTLNFEKMAEVVNGVTGALLSMNR